jgi:hypothetical protein
MAGVLVRGILLNFLILLSLLLLVSAAIGHLYGPQLRSLPSSADLTLPKLEQLANRLTQKDKSSVDKWLVDHLSDETRAALEAGDDGRKDLKVALAQDFRHLIDGELIYETKRFENVEMDPVKTGLIRELVDDNDETKELICLEGRSGFWAWISETFSLSSRSCLRRLNRLLLEAAYPEIKPLEPLKPLISSDSKNTSKEEIQRKEIQETCNKKAAKVKATGEAPETAEVVEAKKAKVVNECVLLRKIRLLTSPGSGWFEKTGWLPPMPVPFTLTVWALLGALLWFLLSPVWVLLVEIGGYKKSIERAGSNSSVNLRDKFERRFGIALLVVLVFALFETLPILVGKFHQFLVSPEIDWNPIFASVAGVAVAVLGGASKLLTVLGGAKKKIAILLIGLLGVLVPLLSILYVTEFVVYDDPLQELLNKLVFVVPSGFLILFGLATIVGLRSNSFERSELYLLGLLAASMIIGMFAIHKFLGTVLVEESQTGSNHYIVLILAFELFLFCWLVVDVNRTSIHGLYRDRLASAYLAGIDSKGDIAIEEDINLGEIGCHEAGSTAPYHLVNVCLNLQGSIDPNIRDRASDFFIFSKRFIGGKRTGYCRTETMEQVHPQMSLATAMAISAAAASPNMGRGTNPALVAFMALLNIRLGYWLPNPGLLEEIIQERPIVQWLMKIIGKRNATQRTPGGFNFEDVFQQELVDIERRWKNVYQNGSENRKLHMKNDNPLAIPTTEHGLVGIGFSGGGIRSATINLGITQALHERGVFEHADYMSTVSGGGYLGSSISTLMRRKTKSVGEVAEQSGVRKNSCTHQSEIDGEVSLETNAAGDKIVRITGRSVPGEQREYLFARFDSLVVKSGELVKSGQELIKRHNTLGDRFRWRVPPRALWREMMMKLDERYKWVNLSDGGHIENLAGIELLRRRCKFMIIGDGEADPELSFNGLATLIRYARIDLGITIDIDPDTIRVDKSEATVYQGKGNLSAEHWAFGTITYPPNEDCGPEPEEGYLLYLKSSFSGDEDEVIKEYRHCNPAFPHQSTADQFFDENQFECYRALGQHIGEKACEELSMAYSSDLSSFDNFAEAMKVRAMVAAVSAKALAYEEKTKKELKWAEDYGSYIEQCISEASNGSVSKDSSKEVGKG